ncbi:PqqD family protein [Thermophagus sp. OGC60D27]|uniref:PqqD family protein n=1 Tax=Thermophagus sp. OGC60D27 TaxID=3458415 RepID=UPI0040380F6E
MIDPKALYQVDNDNFVARKMGNEMVMVPLADKVADMTGVLTLNEVGADILLAFEKPSTIENVIGKLMDIYDIDEETLSSDIRLFMEKAMKNNVIIKVG